MKAQREILTDIQALGERQVLAIVSTPDLARDGDILVTAGIDLTYYKANPIVLWSHNMSQPIAVTRSIGLDDRQRLVAKIEFPEPGISPLADEICGLVKTAGIVRALSVGFTITEAEPLDPRQSYGGLRILQSVLNEISFVSIPADTGAIVIARSGAESTMRMRAMIARLRPIPDLFRARAWRRVIRARIGRGEQAVLAQLTASPAHYCAAIRRQAEQRVLAAQLASCRPGPRFATQAERLARVFELKRRLL